MNLKEIHDAAMNGRTFRFTGKIEQFSFENGKLKIDWVFPDAGKPFNSNHDFAYIELAPKYDPCRKLKKGDRVEVVKNKGRIGSTETPVGTLATVTEDEEEAEWIYIQAEGSNKIDTIDPAYLELVTPVEELEPYSVAYWVDTSEECGRFEVVRGEQCVSIYPYGHHETRYYKKAEQAKAAAEAERDRLNAEWRKEQSNAQ